MNTILIILAFLTLLTIAVAIGAVCLVRSSAVSDRWVEEERNRREDT